jgi:hypothetical protein
MKKNEYVYPGSDLDRSKVLISLLGSFWSRTYTGIDQIHSHVDATAYTVAQSHRNLLETVAALSRYDVPLFHEETIAPVAIRRSQLNSAATNTTRFDRTAEKIDAGLQFDKPMQGELFSFPLPASFRGATALLNKITYPTVALLENIDFSVDLSRNALVFTSNPFDNAGFFRRVVANGSETDEEITLWAFYGKFDYEYVFRQFAYAVGIKLRTSQNYKDLTNAIFSSFVDGGASAKNLDLAIAAICGIPVVIDPQETVEVVEYDATGLLVVTDKNVYKFHEDAEPAVSAGMLVRAGDPLVRAFEINEFFVGGTYLKDIDDPIDRPTTTKLLTTNFYETLTAEDSIDDLVVSAPPSCPVKKDLMALALDNNFLSTCFYGDLVFENKVVPLIVDTEHPSGYTFVRFAVGGYPADVDRFFQEIHARGVESAETNRTTCFLHPNEYRTFLDLPETGLVDKIYKTLDDNRYYDWIPVDPRPESGPTGRYEQITQLPPFKKLGTLAHLLDKRRQPDGEPTEKNLPKEINPLLFIIENVLRNNVFVVRINVSALGQNRLGLYNIRHLRQVVPPQTAMIVVFELAAKSDKIDADEYVPDALTTFTGIEPQLDVVNETHVKDLGVLINRISGTCQ